MKLNLLGTIIVHKHYKHHKLVGLIKFLEEEVKFYELLCDILLEMLDTMKTLTNEFWRIVTQEQSKILM